jgi:hypothetical protein
VDGIIFVPCIERNLPLHVSTAATQQNNVEDFDKIIKNNVTLRRRSLFSSNRRAFTWFWNSTVFNALIDIFETCSSVMASNSSREGMGGGAGGGAG